MQGLFKRKGSDIWQGRFRIPEDLWSERDRLRSLGVSDINRSQQFALSTGQHDRDEAGITYRSMLLAWDAKLKAWRSLLENGPESLTPKQRMALAADHAKAFLDAHSDDPFSAPNVPELPEIDGNDEEDFQTRVRSLPPADRKALKVDLETFLDTDEEARHRMAFRLLESHPVLRDTLKADLRDAVETMHGADTETALANRGLHVDAKTRRLLDFEMLRFMGAAFKGLEAMQGGDYSPVRQLEVAPTFVPAARRSVGTGGDSRFTFENVIKTEAERRAKGRDAKPFPDKTVKKYARQAATFVAWRRSQGLPKQEAEDASTVSRLEVENWREALQSDSSIGNRTVNDKVSCVSTIIKWGRRLFGREGFHQNGHPLEGMEKLDYVALQSHERTYRLEEAVAVLEAARRETDPRRRWLPWICAYSGLRIEEAGQLETGDFFKVGERWFFRVSTSGRRSLKTASSERRIPVHPSLLREGLIDYVHSIGTGRLFKSKRIQQHMSEWVREVVGIDRKELSPNHGWRHFFEDLCALSNMPDAARDYMTGRATGKSRDLYGRSELMLPGLAEAMDRVPDIIEYGRGSVSGQSTE